MLAEMLGAWLSINPQFIVEGYATNGSQGWELCEAKRPDLVLLDVAMPGGDGLSLAQRLIELLPGTRVVILTGRVDPYTTWRADQIGVHGLADKSLKPEELVRVVQVVSAGGTFTSPAFQRVRAVQLAAAEAFHKLLTNRELAVLHALTGGLSDEAISTQLKISAATVACHRKNIRKKLDVHDDRGLIAYGLKWGTFGSESPLPHLAAPGSLAAV